MCGITGWVAFDRDLMQERALIDAMTETMACRGPDASGVWSDQNATFGHRRLAVIDIPGGAQPMSVSTPNGDVVMVYSGEAYNFKELRDELGEAGREVRRPPATPRWCCAATCSGVRRLPIGSMACTRSPSGTRAMRKLVMIRDRMGIKPFYFYPTPDGVLFGSEPKAILANPLAKRIVDIDGLREMIGPGQDTEARCVEGHAGGGARHHRHG